MDPDCVTVPTLVEYEVTSTTWVEGLTVTVANLVVVLVTEVVPVDATWLTVCVLITVVNVETCVTVVVPTARRTRRGPAASANSSRLAMRATAVGMQVSVVVTAFVVVFKEVTSTTLVAPDFNVVVEVACEPTTVDELVVVTAFGVTVLQSYNMSAHRMRIG